MNKKYIVVLVLFLLSVYGCSSAPEFVLDSFEGALTHETVDYGEGGGAKLLVSADTENKADGEQSIKLEYDISAGGYLWAARGYNLDVKGAALWRKPPEKIKWNKFAGLSLRMYGTNSGGKVAFDIKDSGSEMWRFMLEDDFEGWKEIVIPFGEFFVRADWQPYNADRNGEMNFPIMSFQFEPRRPHQNVYRFDRVALIRKQ